MTTATEGSRGMVEIPFDLLSVLTALAASARDGVGACGLEAHEIRDALGELHADLNRIEGGTIKAWGMDSERRARHTWSLVKELMERTGHL